MLASGETGFENEIAALGPAGKEALVWLQTQGDNINQVFPMALELARLADRLSEVRAKIRAQGVTLGAGKRNPLLATEIQLTKAYAGVWKTLGLADKDEETKRRVGRPNGGGGMELFR
jgi:hypothetical protein